MKKYVLSHLWNKDTIIEAEGLQEAIRKAFIIKNMSLREVKK